MRDEIYAFHYRLPDVWSQYNNANKFTVEYDGSRLDPETYAIRKSSSTTDQNVLNEISNLINSGQADTEETARKILRSNYRNQAWNLQRELLDQTPQAILNTGVNFNTSSFDPTDYLKMATYINQKSVDQVLGAHDRWQAFAKAVIDKGDNGLYKNISLWGFDTETLGDIADGTSTITELGVNLRRYDRKLHSVPDPRGQSFVVPMTSAPQKKFMMDTLEKFRKYGWDSLSESERISMERAAVYAGNYTDVFTDVEVDLFGQKHKYKVVKKGKPTNINYAEALSGWRNFEQASNAILDSKNGFSNAADDFISLVIDKIVDNPTDTNFLNAANSEFDVNRLIAYVKQSSKTLQEKEILIKKLKIAQSKILDNIHIVRAVAEAQHLSPLELNELLYGKRVGVSINERLEALGLQEHQAHIAISDINNQGLLIDNDVILFSNNSNALEALKKEPYTKQLTYGDLDNTVFYLRSGALQKEEAKEFVVQAGDDFGTNSYSIKNNFWKVDTSQTKTFTQNIDGQNVTRYSIALRNYAQGADADVMYLVGDTQEEVFERLHRIINGADIYDESSLTQNFIQTIRENDSLDSGRREIARLFDPSEVRMEYDNTLKRQIGANGYQKLAEIRKFNEAYNNHLASINPLTDYDARYRDLKSFIEQTFGTSRRSSNALKNGLINTPYEMQAFLSYKRILDNESPVHDVIFKAVNDYFKNSPYDPSQPLSGINSPELNREQTVLFSKIRKALAKVLESENIELDNSGAFEYFKDRGRFSYSDLYDFDIISDNGAFKRINDHSEKTIEQGIKNFLDEAKDNNTIINGLNNLQDRGIIKDASKYIKTLDSLLPLNAKQKSSYTFGLSTEIATEIWKLKNTPGSILADSITSSMSDEDVQKRILHSIGHDNYDIDAPFLKYKDSSLRDFFNNLNSNPTQAKKVNDAIKEVFDNYTPYRYITSAATDLQYETFERSLLEALGMNYGTSEDIAAKTKLLNDILLDSKKYSLNSKKGKGLQALIITPYSNLNVAKHEGKSGYMLLTKTGDSHKLASFIDNLTDDEFKNITSSYKNVMDSDISKYATVVELPRVREFDIRSNNSGLASVESLRFINQGDNYPKYLHARSLDTYLDKNGILQVSEGDGSTAVLSIFRKGLANAEELALDGNYGEGSRRMRRILTDYLGGLASDNSISGVSRNVHLNPNSIMNAFGYSYHKGLRDIFEQLTLGSFKNPNAISAELNPAQLIVKTFAEHVGLGDVNSLYSYREILNSQEFHEFFHRRMLIGTVLSEDWQANGVSWADQLRINFKNAGYEDFFDTGDSKNFLNIINDLIHDDRIRKDSMISDFAVDAVSRVVNVNKTSGLNPIGSESALERGIYYSRMFGDFQTHSGLYNIMRPLYVQQGNPVTYDINQVSSVLSQLSNNVNAPNMAKGLTEKGYSAISFGNNAMTHLEKGIKDSLEASTNGKITLDEHEFMARFKFINDADLQIKYNDILSDNAAIDSLAKKLSQTGVSVDSKQTRELIKVFQAHYNSLYEDKMFANPFIQQFDFFTKPDAVKLELNWSKADIQRTTELLNNLVGKDIDTNTVIGFRNDGSRIFFNKPKSILTQENVDQLLSGIDNGIGKTRLETYVGDIVDQKITINGLEKATVHSIRPEDIYSIINQGSNVYNKQQANTLLSTLFGEMFDGAIFVGNPNFSKHGGIMHAQAIFDLATDRYSKAGQVDHLVDLMNQAAKDTHQFDPINGKTPNISFQASADNKRLYVTMAEMPDPSSFDLKLKDLLREDATKNGNSISQSIINELDDLEATMSDWFTFRRQIMNDHMGKYFVMDKRAEQGIIFRGLFKDPFGYNDTVHGIDPKDVEYMQLLKKEALEYGRTHGETKSLKELKYLGKELNDYAMDLNYERARQNNPHQELRRGIVGTKYSKEFLEGKYTLEDIKKSNILTLTLDEIVEGNGERMRTGYDRVKDLDNTMFFIDGKPSEFLLKKAREQGVDLNNDSFNIFVALDNNPDVHVIKPKVNGTELEGLLIPIHGVTTIQENEKFLFQKSIGIVNQRLKEIDELRKNPGKFLVNSLGNTIGNDDPKIIREVMNERIGKIYSTMVKELYRQTDFMKKDTDIYKAFQSFVMPNSSEYLGQSEFSPLLEEQIAKNSNVRKAYEKLRGTSTQKGLYAQLRDNPYDMSIIEELTQAKNDFDAAIKASSKEVLTNSSNAAKLILPDNVSDSLKKLARTTINGVEYNGLVVQVSQQALERQGYDFSIVAADIINDYEKHMKDGKYTIEGMSDLVQSSRFQKSYNDLIQAFNDNTKPPDHLKSISFQSNRIAGLNNKTLEDIHTLLESGTDKDIDSAIKKMAKVDSKTYYQTIDKLEIKGQGNLISTLDNYMGVIQEGKKKAQRTLDKSREQIHVLEGIEKVNASVKDRDAYKQIRAAMQDSIDSAEKALKQYDEILEGQFKNAEGLLGSNLKLFKQSGIAQQFFSEVGIFAEFLRFPSFRSQPIVRLALGEHLSGNQVNVSNPILSYLTHLDFDGDKVFVSTIADGASILKSNSKLFNLQKTRYERFITREAPILLSEAIKEGNPFLFNDPSAVNKQKSKLLEIIDSKEYQNSIKEYLNNLASQSSDNRIHLNGGTYKVEDILSNQKDKKFSGIFEAALHSNEVDSFFKSSVGNTLLNEAQLVSATVARLRKNLIGHVSTPMYRIKETFYQTMSLKNLTGEQTKLMNESLISFSNMLSGDGGLFSVTEQTAVDPKHARDSLDLSKIRRFSEHAYGFLETNDVQAQRLHMIGMVDSIGSKVLKINDNEIETYVDNFIMGDSLRKVNGFSKNGIPHIGPGVTLNQIDDALRILKQSNLQGVIETVTLNGKVFTQDDTALLEYLRSFHLMNKAKIEVPELTEVWNTVMKRRDLFGLEDMINNLKSLNPKDVKKLVSAIDTDMAEYLMTKVNALRDPFDVNTLYTYTGQLGKNNAEINYYAYTGNGKFNRVNINDKGVQLKGEVIDLHSPNATFEEKFFKQITHDSSKGSSPYYIGNLHIDPELRVNIQKDAAEVKLTGMLDDAILYESNGTSKIRTAKINKNTNTPEFTGTFEKSILRATGISKNKYGRISNLGQFYGEAGSSAPMTSVLQQILGITDTDPNKALSAIITTFDETKKLGNAYESWRAQYMIDAGQRGLDPAVELLRSVNKNIANNGRKINFNDKDAIKSLGTLNEIFKQTIEQEVLNVDSSANMQHHYNKVNALGNFDFQNYYESIEKLRKNVYDIPSEAKRLQGQYDILEQYIKKIQAKPNAPTEQLDTLKEMLSHKYTDLGPKGTPGSLIDIMENERLNSIKQAQDKIFSMLVKSDDAASLFNFNGSFDEMRVGFGSFMGTKFSNLNSKDYDYVLEEASKMLGKKPSDKIKFSVETTLKKLEEYKASGHVFKASDALSLSGMSESISHRVESLKAQTDSIISYLNKNKVLSDREIIKILNNNNANNPLKRRTLSQFFDDTLSDLDISKKHVGMAAGSLVALGLLTNVMHKDQDKTPLQPQESGLYNQPNINGKQVPSTPKSRNVIYQDTHSGLSFNIRAKTQMDINAQNNGAIINKAGGGSTSMYSYIDNSGVNDNWLANKFAELAQ